MSLNYCVSFSIFDLQSCQSDPLLQGLLDNIPIEDLDKQNEAFREKNRVNSIFSIFPQQEVSSKFSDDWKNKILLFLLFPIQHDEFFNVIEIWMILFKQLSRRFCIVNRLAKNFNYNFWRHSSSRIPRISNFITHEKLFKEFSLSDVCSLYSTRLYFELYKRKSYIPIWIKFMFINNFIYIMLNVLQVSRGSSLS